MLTTAGDYARFMARFLTDGDSVVTDPIRREMLTPVTRVSPATSFGLGWGLEQDGGVTSFYHFGGNRGFNTFAVADLERKLGTVVLTNSEEGQRLYWAIGYGFTGRGAAALLA
jgi:CubicO group peptidase (beta-lactamase class C family)